jgi:hypothetical protein
MLGRSAIPLYFGPHSIWAQEFHREPGWWTTDHTSAFVTKFIGPFTSEEDASEYARGVPNVKYPVREYVDDNILPAHYPEGFGAPKVDIEKLSLEQLIQGFAGTEIDVKSVRDLVIRCLRSLITENPRPDMRIVIDEKIKELEWRQKS